jgi:predicted regulator of Ras-like GTPase activity (Roadblock/LC7/MglB family)
MTALWTRTKSRSTFLKEEKAVPDDTNTELLQKILEDLNSHIEGLEQIAIIQRDGTVLAQLPSAEKVQHTAGVFTEFAKLTDDVCQVLERGANTEAIMKGQNRFLALYRTTGTHTILGIVGQSSINFGLLNSGCRIAIEKIETISAD